MITPPHNMHALTNPPHAPRFNSELQAGRCASAASSFKEENYHLRFVSEVGISYSFQPY
ncbi:predicted protein [Botrytis cinerea T4]|uniref:Uncharacterized protein n=1 Tax=Botryotinia fuckeliana (strain T4) TaxID=999810 RepID=G2YPE9_BOTF4|nr:predicted protein [Botrytis cinerea T4]